MVEIVTIAYQDLLDGKDISEQILKAFGTSGLGALTISGIPNYKELRHKLLPLSHKLAHLPDEIKKKLEHEASMWNVGWSHGKEKLADKPDLSKGSFYANPIYDIACEDEKLKSLYPFAYPDNIWPKDDLPELEGAFKDLGKLMYETVLLLAKHIDTFTSARVPTYENNHLFNQLSTTRKIKGRLLYYYPCSPCDEEDSWIGWHNDSGFLTALTSAMFFDDETSEEVTNPDPNGGLWIVDRGHSPVRVKIPSDNMAVQCGECLQIITGGLLVATPHCVRASYSPEGVKIGRATFPVFVDTPIEYPLSAPKGVARDRIFDQTVHSRVPPLEQRWKEDGQLFGDFLSDTFSQYYSWNKI